MATATANGSPVATVSQHKAFRLAITGSSDDAVVAVKLVPNGAKPKDWLLQFRLSARCESAAELLATLRAPGRSRTVIAIRYPEQREGRGAIQIAITQSDALTCGDLADEIERILAITLPEV